MPDAKGNLTQAERYLNAAAAAKSPRLKEIALKRAAEAAKAGR